MIECLRRAVQRGSCFGNGGTTGVFQYGRREWQPLLSVSPARMRLNPRSPQLVGEVGNTHSSRGGPSELPFSTLVTVGVQLVPTGSRKGLHEKRDILAGLAFDKLVFASL